MTGPAALSQVSYAENVHFTPVSHPEKAFAVRGKQESTGRRKYRETEVREEFRKFRQIESITGVLSSIGLSPTVEHPCVFTTARRQSLKAPIEGG
jgi:hypothetical protein